jgi:Got1/Sft2-like family
MLVSVWTQTAIQVRTKFFLLPYDMAWMLHPLTFCVDRNMFDEKRRYTTIVYLSCLFATIIVVFLPIDGTIKLVLLLLLLVAQFCASLWYTLSYIPYGRRTFIRVLRGVFGIEDEG